MINLKSVFQIFILLHSIFKISYCDDNPVVLTVATENTDGLTRFLRSAKVYGITVEVLGLGESWNGGDMNYAGGGQKISILKKRLEELSHLRNADDKIILFTDSYDVMFLSHLDKIIETFKSFENTRVLFSAEQLCWPDASLASQYPDTKSSNPYLNSGGFIGYLPEIFSIVSNNEIKDDDDDQLYYTKIYLDKELRENLKIKLDHKSEIFQNLHGAYSEVVLQANSSVEWPYIENIALNTTPLIVHGNGPTKVTLSSLSSYLARSWSPVHGCRHCEETKRTFTDDTLPRVMVALFVEQPTPFLEEFFKSVLAFDYPKDKIDLFVRNNVQYHEKTAEEFVKNHGQEYASIKRIKPTDYIDEPEARNLVLDRCTKTACGYLFVVDVVARLEPHTLRTLLESGKDVIAPMLVRPGQAWSNFWGALNSAGFYARSIDYMDIVNANVRGIWNVPFITHSYLVNMDILKKHREQVTYEKQNFDADMTFCDSLRHLGIFMYVDNLMEFGHLINPETYDITRTHPNIYQIFENRKEWEARYIHPEYYNSFEEGVEPKMPCPDVYWFPMVSMRFCKEWIDVMEAFGKWSDGSNSDKRLEGGYEAVPTRDIHMNQIGLDKQWLHILKEYVRPLQELVFTGYYHDPPVSLMNFVVRYRPDEQPSLRPHHDSSTYTINLALNTPGLDYEGGGCHFLRYKCSVRDTKPGWLLMHPGRLTHFHEGLRVTNGTRYIMISFIDP